MLGAHEVRVDHVVLDRVTPLPAPLLSRTRGSGREGSRLAIRGPKRPGGFWPRRACSLTFHRSRGRELRRGRDRAQDTRHEHSALTFRGGSRGPAVGRAFTGPQRDFSASRDLHLCKDLS